MNEGHYVARGWRLDDVHVTMGSSGLKMILGRTLSCFGHGSDL